MYTYWEEALKGMLGYCMGVGSRDHLTKDRKIWPLRSSLFLTVQESKCDQLRVQNLQADYGAGREAPRCCQCQHRHHLPPRHPPC